MSEQVQVIERRFGHFPARFKRGDELIKVDAVERCWTEMKRLQGKALFHFRVRCGSRRYHLSEDSGSGRWTVRPTA